MRAWPLLPALLLAMLAGPAPAAERSLLFSAAERQQLACVLATGQGVGPGPARPALAESPRQPGDPAPVAHLSSLIHAGEGEWEFRLDGQVGRPGRLPPGILAAQVTADQVTVARLDPADGSRRTLTLRVGERRPWPRPANVAPPPPPQSDQDKRDAEVLPSAECPPSPVREARP